MTKNYSLFLMAASMAVLTACTTVQTPAPVVDRSDLQPTVTPPKAAPVEEPKDKEGYYTVHKGDTLIRIAFDRGLNYRELAAWNNLSNPDDIKVDQVLRLTQPEGVQTASVPMPPQIDKTPPPPRKSTPKGEKRPYSESAVAELQKSDDRAEKPALVASLAPAPAPAPAPSMSAEDRDLSWTWPSDGRVVGQFDEGKNKGIDIAGRAGQQVLAAERGKVMYAGSGIRGYGNLVIVKHSNSLLSAYAHNRAILVKEGQEVRRGQAIAEMGDSDTDSVKLHFEIRQQGKPVDPSKFLPNR